MTETKQSNMINVNTPLTIFWFRRDLRWDDNHGLFEALKHSQAVLPVFIFDKTILDKLENKQDARVSLIHYRLSLMQAEISKLGSSLYIIHDHPLSAFQNLTKKFQIIKVITNSDYEPDAIKRDLEISHWLHAKGIGFETYKDQVIFEKAEVMKGDGSPYTVFTPYSKVWKAQLNNITLESYESELLLSNLIKTEPLHFPDLAEMGFQQVDLSEQVSWPNTNIISNYHLTRNIPSINGTSSMSVNLRFGMISVRSMVKLASQLNEQWLNELIWREFFMMILYHFPKVVHQAFKKKYDDILWRNDELEFTAWCAGKTGYPIVDAGMRELNQTGLMHNRVRMIVASFLTKHLLIDWRWGEAYFANKLLDYELSSNNGNWQWAAGCGCDAAPYFRVFSPAEQTKKFDPKHLYIKKWVPESQSNYIRPIVEHDFARKRALEVYKKGLNTVV